MNSATPRTARRSFLKASLAAGAAPFLLPGRTLAADPAPAEKIRMAFIGNGIQNGGLMRTFMGNEGVTVMAVCDVDTTRRENAKKVVEDFYQSKGRTEKVDTHKDFREIIARKDIDAVCVATPDHWHALITLAALNSGKDVYCEKPLVHSIEEATAVIEAVKRNQRVLQTGSMQRSMKEFRAACEIVRNGFIGEVKSITCSFGVPAVDCDLPEEPLEPGLDWEMWQGPAAHRGYNSILSPRGVHNHFPLWRLYREYGGGYVTDWGAHHLDIAQWALGMDESGPVKVIPPADPKATHGAQLVYANGVAVTHVDHGLGVEILGSEGSVRVDRGKIEVIVKGETLASFVDKTTGTSLDREVAKLDSTLLKDPKIKLYRTPNGNHLQDFLTCVRNRQKPCTHEIIGARSATVCNLMNLVYQHRKPIGWNPENFTFTEPAGDASWLKYAYQNGWKLA